MTKKKVTTVEPKADCYKREIIHLGSWHNVALTKNDKTIMIPIEIDLEHNSFTITSANHDGDFTFKNCHHPDHDIHIIETLLEATKFAKEQLDNHPKLSF